MRRFFLRSFLICLLPCLLAAYAAAFGTYKLGIDLAGGTILVYEVNLERTQERQATERGAGQPQQSSARSDGLQPEEMQQLAAAIKRRIDPADLRNITVRPLGNTRVEIILPTGGASARGKTNLTEAEIEEVKQLISQVGVLEFRILANATDDGPGIQDARALVDGKSQEDLDARAKKGLPPESPAGEYPVAIGGSEEKVRYFWVEMGREERETLGLNNAAEANPNSLWHEAARNRNRTFVHTYGNEGKQASMVLFSRKAVGEAQLAKEAAEKERRARDGNTDPVDEKKWEYFVLTRVSPLDQVKVGGEVTITASADTDPKTFNPCVNFRFNGAGASLFQRMTTRNQPDSRTNTIRTLAIILDERVVSAPTLNAVIGASGTITGKFDQKAVGRLVQILRSGALTAELRDRPVSENTMGPTLGADTIRRGTLAIGLAFAAVLAFMVVYYRFAGLVACIALFANLLLTVGFMVAVNAAFTLPGLAGIVLMLGMAVDANVLIYERLREERNKGANLITAIRNGYDRAFPTIIDTHLSSIFTAIVLYTFGNDQLKGFSISLTVGLVISLFTSLFMTRLMFDFWLSRRWLTELRMMRLFERPNLEFMRIRHYMFGVTAALTVLGLGLFLYRGENVLNVDFRGGTVYGGRLAAGEERALTTTGDGKLGLRDLLDQPRQNKLLQVKDVRWLNKPSAGDFADARRELNEFLFEVTYADGGAYRVSFAGSSGQAQAADQKGGTEQEWRSEADALANVRERAGQLPDVSVEQVFLTGESYPEGKSRFFTVRTTEHQPELVQVLLDRLLRDDQGRPLQAVIAVAENGVRVTGPRAELTFTEPVSVGFMRNLLTREFKLNSAEAEAGETTFDLTGVPTGTDEEKERQRQQSRFRVMTLDVSKNRKFAALTALETAAALAPLAGGMAFADPAGQAAQQEATLKDILDQAKRELEARPPYERLETFDSQLAAETRTKAAYAIVASWVAILLYLWFRFGNWTFGLAAVLCLVHDLCFTLGVIAGCHYVYDTWFGVALGLHDFKIDLPAVAALLTLVGYSVNDTIVVFDRIREVRGKNPALTAQTINDSVNQTLSRTVLASLTVFLVVAVLYWFGGEGVHLFSFVMVVGVIVGTYSSIYVASPLLLLLGEGRGATATDLAPRAEEAAV